MKSEKIYGAAMMVLQSEAIEKELLIENIVNNASEHGENIIGDLVGHIKDLVFLEKAVFRTRQLIAAKKKLTLKAKLEAEKGADSEEVILQATDVVESGQPLSDSEVTTAINEAKQKLRAPSPGARPAVRKR